MSWTIADRFLVPQSSKISKPCTMPAKHRARWLNFGSPSHWHNMSGPGPRGSSALLAPIHRTIPRQMVRRKHVLLFGMISCVMGRMVHTSIALSFLLDDLGKTVVTQCEWAISAFRPACVFSTVSARWVSGAHAHYYTCRVPWRCSFNAAMRASLSLWTASICLSASLAFSNRSSKMHLPLHGWRNEHLIRDLPLIWHFYFSAYRTHIRRWHEHPKK